MKSLSLGLLLLLTLSCGSKDDNSCTCIQEKWQRSVVKEIATQNVVSISEWQVSSPGVATGSDCDTNGRVTSSGSENSHPIGNGQYSVVEFKYQIKCN